MQFNDTANAKQDKTNRSVREMAKTTAKDAGCNDGAVINPHKLYTTADLATLLGVSRRTIVRYRTERGLPVSREPRGTITGRTLLKWLESRGKN